MSTTTSTVELRETAGLNKWLVAVGTLLWALCVLMFLNSAYMKLTHLPSYVRTWQYLGFKEDMLNGVGIMELAILALYLIPWTSILGVVLITGYIGGAVTASYRIGLWAGIYVQMLTAIFAWAGLWVRDQRLRQMLPFRWKAMP